MHNIYIYIYHKIDKNTKNIDPYQYEEGDGGYYKLNGIGRVEMCQSQAKKWATGPKCIKPTHVGPVCFYVVIFALPNIRASLV